MLDELNFFTMDEGDYAALMSGIREFGRRAALDNQLDALYKRMYPDQRLPATKHLHTPVQVYKTYITQHERKRRYAR